MSAYFILFSGAGKGVSLAQQSLQLAPFSQMYSDSLSISPSHGSRYLDGLALSCPCDLVPSVADIEEDQRVAATLQVLQTLPEENYLVLRFLTAFLAQVSGLSWPSMSGFPERYGGVPWAAGQLLFIPTRSRAVWQGAGHCFPAVTPLLLALSQISSHSDQNKMTNANLAVVFGPNLLWAKDAAITLKAINPINTFTKFLLDHQAELFPTSEGP